MQLQMTERDKKLIVFLVIFVLVVAGGYWGVYPMISSGIKSNKEIELERQKQQENELKVAQLTLIEIENENLEADIEAAREKYFPMMTSNEVDKYMTGLILDYGLISYDLNITMPTEEAKVEPYQYSEKALNGTLLEELPEQSNTGNTVVEEDIPVTTGIYAVSVSMRVGGDSEAIDRLIDKLSASDEALQLTGYSWGNERSISYKDDGTYEINTNRTITMQIMLYMCGD